ncbi:hypothetical protein [Hahella sp. HN01]|uniref:hypothetical protein n=1 Tax=Hahella sp. HN01 TaxID=2847262 RepID=UPI001C1ED67A|nr:hypothetical protein [Hahella sp. HN01]MBU6953126.1 hypothetical protein [Hahella sp. HN01]
MEKAQIEEFIKSRGTVDDILSPSAWRAFWTRLQNELIGRAMSNNRAADSEELQTAMAQVETVWRKLGEQLQERLGVILLDAPGGPNKDSGIHDAINQGIVDSLCRQGLELKFWNLQLKKSSPKPKPQPQPSPFKTGNGVVAEPKAMNRAVRVVRPDVKKTLTSHLRSRRFVFAGVAILAAIGVLALPFGWVTPTAILWWLAFAVFCVAGVILPNLYGRRTTQFFIVFAVILGLIGLLGKAAETPRWRGLKTAIVTVTYPAYNLLGLHKVIDISSVRQLMVDGRTHISVDKRLYDEVVGQGELVVEVDNQSPWRLSPRGVRVFAPEQGWLRLRAFGLDAPGLWRGEPVAPYSRGEWRLLIPSSGESAAALTQAGLQDNASLTEAQNALESLRGLARYGEDLSLALEPQYQISYYDRQAELEKMFDRLLAN